MNEREIDFNFIREVGYKVYEILINDTDQVEWFYNIKDNFETMSSNPSQIVLTIIEYLSSLGDEYCTNIVKDIKAIIKEDENYENLLNDIFNPQHDIEEEEEEEAVDYSQPQESPIEIGEQNLNPQSHFDSIIQKMMNTLYISHDIAYLLLKKFQWKESLIIQHWISDKEKILNSLRIKIGSEMVPDCKSPLTVRSCGIGECPICCSECPLLEMYCGHKFCQECFFEEIKTQILENKVPVCRQARESDNQKQREETCSAEIMYDNIKEILLNTLNDNQLFQKYTKIFLSSEIYEDPEAKYCTNQYCNYIITSDDELPCHIGLCPMCHTAMCLKCNRSAHAPLIDCSKIDDFLVTQAQAMQDLNEHQEQWFKREEKMKLYRFNHPEEVRDKFREEIKKMREEHQQKSIEEEEQIRKLESEMEKINKEITKLEKKKEKTKEENSTLQELIINKDLKILHKKRLDIEHEFNSQDRLKCISAFENEQSLYMKAINDVENYNTIMEIFKQTINKQAIESISEQLKQSQVFIETFYKKCPHCQTPIERTIGCNHMTCQICHFEFCYVCGEEWSGHDNFYICSRYSFKYKSLSRNSNANYFYDDTTFYLPPMTAEKKADYLQWNDLYARHQFQSEKYDQLFKEFTNKNDEEPTSGRKGLTFSQLCTRNKIAHILLRDTDRKLVKLKTLKIMNTLLFAQSLLVWGPPALFYMKNDKKKAMLIEYKLSLLEESINNFLNLIHKPGKSNSEDYETNAEIVNRKIYDILKMTDM